MTDEAGTPVAESATVSDTAPVLATSDDGMTVDQAVAAYEAKLNKDTAAESAEPATAATESVGKTDAAPPEKEATSEDASEVDPAEQPSLDLPRSWTKDRTEHWKRLDPATQEFLLEQDRKNSIEVRRSQNEAADLRKAADAERQAAVQAKKAYEDRLPALEQALNDVYTQNFADIRTVDDVSRIATEDPMRYLQWHAHQTKMQAVRVELQQAEAARTADEANAWAQHVQQENALFAEYVPEFADKDKAQALTTKAVDQLHELGFKDSELNDLASGKQKLSIYDHRIQRLLFTAIKFAEMKAAPPKAIQKPVPVVQRPGVAQPKGAAHADNIRDLTQKLNRSGSVEDALELYMARQAAG